MRTRSSREAVLSTAAAEHSLGRAEADGVAARARGLTKAYGSGETAVLALDSVDVDITRGRFTAVMGPSGSGKSTLMHCLAGLDTVSAGQVWLGDTEITALKDRELTRLRRDRIGFMFQSFNLIPTLNAAENITLPMDIAGRNPTRSGWTRSSTRSDCATGCGTGRPSCPAASSSGSPAPAPARPGPS
jgi:putative ABC transport system ATP-binding protein